MICPNDDALTPSVEALLPEVPGAPEQLVRTHLWAAWRSFCKKTEIWRYPFEPLRVTAGEITYRIPEMDGVMLLRVIDLWHLLPDGGEVRIPGREDVQRTLDSYQWWYEPQPGTLVLNVEPDRPQELRANVALWPARDAGIDVIPLELVEHWREEVEAGALRSLYLLPKQPWSSPDLAAIANADWMAGIADARAKHLHDMRAGRPAYRNSFTVGLRG